MISSRHYPSLSNTSSLLNNPTSKSVSSSSPSYGSMNYSNYGADTAAPYASAKGTNSSSGGAFHPKYSSCAYDPFSASLTTTPNETTKLLATATHNTTSPAANSAESSTPAADSSKLAKATLKRNNKKAKRSGDTQASGASRIYSEHYTEDSDSLLQFITNTPAETLAPNKGSKKAVKQGQAKTTNGNEATANRGNSGGNKVNRDKSINEQKTQKKGDAALESSAASTAEEKKSSGVKKESPIRSNINNTSNNSNTDENGSVTEINLPSQKSPESPESARKSDRKPSPPALPTLARDGNWQTLF